MVRYNCRIKNNLALSAAAICFMTIAPTQTIAADHFTPVYFEPAYDFQVKSSHWYLRGELGINLNVDRQGLYNDIGSISGDDAVFEGFNYRFSAGRRLNEYVRLEVSAGQSFLPEEEITVQLYRTGTQPAGTPAYAVVSAAAANPCNGFNRNVDPITNLNVDDPTFIDNCTRTDVFDYNAISVMANAYFDLPEFYGFRPFIGGGLGLSRVTWKERANEIRCTPVEATIRTQGCTALPAGGPATINAEYTLPAEESEEVQYNLAWSLAGGVAYQVNEEVAVEALYRYMNLGGIESLSSTGTVFDFDSLETHSVNFGVRVALF